jgi:hypothetical protein
LDLRYFLYNTIYYFKLTLSKKPTNYNPILQSKRLFPHWYKRHICQTEKGTRMENRRNHKTNLCCCNRENPSKRPQNKENTGIFSATLKNIEKALEKLNQRKPPTNPKTKLPQYYHNKLDIKIFNPKVVGQEGLPPHRPGINHAIELEKNEFRRKKDVPRGLLYCITKEKLLMLRKTLTDHLDKRWIRVSKSPAGASVLFVRKPGDSLRFCMNYRKLNEITKKNRTLLPLITETLRMIAKAE